MNILKLWTYALRKSPAQTAFEHFDVVAAFDESVGRSTGVVAEIFLTSREIRDARLHK